MQKKRVSLSRLNLIELEVPQAKQNFNRELFTEVAPQYGRITHLLSFGRDPSWKRALIAGLPNLPARSLCVDLACGTGDIAVLLARRYPDCHILGIDQNADMIAEGKHQWQHIENITLATGDMQHLPVADQTAAVVTGGYAIRNAPRLETALVEIHRVLQAGGTGAFLDFSKPSNRAAQRLELSLLGLWGNLFGALFHRNPDVYGYIAKSLDHFPDRDQLTEALDAAGLETRRTRHPFAGCLELRWVRKQNR